MIKFSEYLNEAVKKMSDDKIDAFIAKEWDGSAQTFFYNAEAVMEIAVALKGDDVLITKDKKFFHIPESSDRKINNLVAKILIKFSVKEAMNESALPDGKEIANNKDGSKFMKTLHKLLDDGAEIESYAMGRWGMMSKGNGASVIVCKRTPSGKISKRKCGVTSFKSGDAVILYDLGDNKFRVKNDFNGKFQD